MLFHYFIHTSYFLSLWWLFIRFPLDRGEEQAHSSNGPETRCGAVPQSHTSLQATLPA